MESFTKENSYKGENIIERGIESNTDTDHFQYCRKKFHYDNDGILFSESIYLDENNTRVRKFYKNGKIKDISLYRYNKLHGERHEYYECGRLKSFEFYFKGKKEGNCKYFYQNF